MFKSFCDRCKKEMGYLKSYEIVHLKIEDSKEYALNDEKGIEYNKILCPDCATDIMNIIDFECDGYKLKIGVETEELTNEQRRENV